MSNNQYIIEFRQIRSLIKVSAIDPITLKEVCVVVPAAKNISQEEMQRLAIQKLEYVLAKTAGKKSEDHSHKENKQNPEDSDNNNLSGHIDQIV